MVVTLGLHGCSVHSAHSVRSTWIAVFHPSRTRCACGRFTNQCFGAFFADFHARLRLTPIARRTASAASTGSASTFASGGNDSAPASASSSSRAVAGMPRFFPAPTNARPRALQKSRTQRQLKPVAASAFAGPTMSGVTVSDFLPGFGLRECSIGSCPDQLTTETPNALLALRERETSPRLGEILPARPCETLPPARASACQLRL